MKINCSYKEEMYNTGVYKILNTITGDFYIGSASRVHKSKCFCGFHTRFAKHKNYLDNNKHKNTHLQRSYNKYGKDNFEFKILEFCQPENCLEREQYYMDNLKPTYNIRKIAAGSNLGIIFTKEHCDRISISNQISKSNPEYLNKIRSTNMRIKLNPEKARDIKLLLSQGFSHGFCAKKYNVSRGAIQNIKEGLTWSDITI
jgi:group I intron endonuclease